MQKKITKAGNTLIKIITTTIAVIFLIYGLLMLWDMYRTEMEAFASYDLLKYRPTNEEELPLLSDLVEINPDTKGWITIYGTHIDYPVMQGKDDYEYLNRDVYRKHSVTGSIYESFKYKPDFSDPYVLLYGHHMANGTMFGDIDKFKKKDFFDKNKTGILILPEKVYDLEVMAILETDAYDPSIFEDYNSECLNRALHKRNIQAEKVIALSTCDEKSSYARSVLLCSATVRHDPVPLRETGKGTQREAVGHPMAGAYWALLNLICLISTIFFAVRILFSKERKASMKKKNKAAWRITAIEIMLAFISLALFFITEDMHRPLQIIDIWTPLMILILAAIWGLEKRQDKLAKKENDNNAE